jgi:hypothetical protein
MSTPWLLLWAQCQPWFICNKSVYRVYTCRQFSKYSVWVSVCTLDIHSHSLLTCTVLQVILIPQAWHSPLTHIHSPWPLAPRWIHTGSSATMVHKPGARSHAADPHSSLSATPDRSMAPHSLHTLPPETPLFHTLRFCSSIHYQLPAPERLSNTQGGALLYSPAQLWNVQETRI